MERGLIFFSSSFSFVSMDTDCSASCLALSNPLNALKARFLDVAFRQ